MLCGVVRDICVNAVWMGDGVHEKASFRLHHGKWAKDRFTGALHRIHFRPTSRSTYNSVWEPLAARYGAVLPPLELARGKCIW